MVNVLRYLEQKTKVQNVFAKLSYKHFQLCHFVTFSMEIYRENYTYFKGENCLELHHPMTDFKI